MSSSPILRPYVDGAAVTPADSDIAPTRGVYVGGTGSLVVTFVDGSSAITIAAIPTGTLLPICVKRIAAASTATNIVALR